MTNAPHISVCVCTYKRPECLKRLLEGLDRQDTGRLFTYSIVVADNDALQSAKGLVAEWRSGSGIDLVYCSETQQNIALARNKALENATGDYIAFIDDDEFPEPDWLRLLFQACQDYRVDGALGPVKPHFDQSPPKWIIKGGFYERPTHETGFIIDWNEGRTGNLLFKRQILEDLPVVFRKEFGSGGEDRDFFRRVIGKGHVFVWCNEAVAYEVVPAVRWTRTFMIKRALLRGKMSLNHPQARRVGVAKSLAAVALYSLVLPFAFVSGQHNFMKYLVKLCDHAGRILAWLGLNPIRTSYVTE
jgi:succinoglycan biosynthesis protein ExoM